MKILFEHNEDRYDLPTNVDTSLLSEKMANINHGQTLHRLDERGGMSVREIICNMHELPLKYQRLLDSKACAAELKMLIKIRTKV